MAQTFPNPNPPAGPTSPEVQAIIQTIKDKK
jgi:hypothetical protein